MIESDLPRILIVDDQETSRYNKARILRRAGFEVIEAKTGEEALRRVSEDKPRLVVLDVHLPGIDGWEVCRRLKADPETSMVPVLQMSATYVTEADTVRSLEGGADGCLTEPVDPPVLVATVRALLRARRAEDALREALAGEQAARLAAESANRAKDEFLATLSHELRSPLGVILSWVTILRRSALPPSRAASALEAIERNARLQTRLIADLLDVSAIISGKMRLEPGVADVRRSVERAIETARPEADRKGIEIFFTAAPHPFVVRGDASRIQQIAWNLLSNAVKFTGRGGRVDAAVDRLGDEIVVRVSDTGMGILPELLPHVFERFRQGDSSTTRPEGGLGLGLAIVRHLVELHDGRVAAESAGAGRGATFTVTLPLEAVTSTGDEGLATGSGLASLADLTRLVVLVVDDDEDAREAVTAVLTAAGARVETAASTAEAIERVAAIEPDVVVTDIGMPDEDGFALLRRFREASSAAIARTPVVALSAYTGGQSSVRIAEAGFDASVTKPVEAGELTAAIAGAAGHRVRS